MNELICDTSGLLSLIDRSDPMHQNVARAVTAHVGSFVLSPLVFAELDYLIRARLNADAARVFADDVAIGAYDLAPLTPAMVGRCVELDRNFADLNLGLTGCHVIALAQASRSKMVLTLDHRHFRAIDDEGGKGLRLLPADAD